MTVNNLEQALETASDLFADLSFGYARRWKDADPSRRVIGYLPIYVPREIVQALGMLPVGIFGAGARLPVVHGDAFFQSYICHLPRTVVELAMGGYLDHFDGFLFPAICDVIRNLSGVFRLNFKDKFVRYLDFPQNFMPQVGGAFYRRELERLAVDLGRLNGRSLDTVELNRSIELYNRNRRLVAALADFRTEFPHKVSAADYYLLLRAGYVMAVEEYNQFLAQVLSWLQAVQAEPEDKIRVVVSGAFCEQPPLGLIKSIENAGCYIVDDDFQMGVRWIMGDIPADTGDPLGALVEAYLCHSVPSAAVFSVNGEKAAALAAAVRERRADGVIFCAPSFCDPALLDRPQLEQALDREEIRHFNFQYHENLGQFQVIKEQAGTFADTIKLWE